MAISDANRRPRASANPPHVPIHPPIHHASIPSSRRRARLRLDELEPRIAPSSLLYSLPFFGAWDLAAETGDESTEGAADFGFRISDFGLSSTIADRGSQIENRIPSASVAFTPVLLLQSDHGTRDQAQDSAAEHGIRRTADSADATSNTEHPTPNTAFTSPDDPFAVLLGVPGQDVELQPRTNALRLSEATGGQSREASALNFCRLQFSQASYSVTENGAVATITVTRAVTSSGDVSVRYATSNNTATAGSDYSTASGTLSWDDGDMTAKTFTVTILNDGAREGDERVNLQLSNPTGGASLGSPSSAVLTITDDEPAQPGQLRFSAATYTVNENGNSATITVTRTGGSDGAISAQYATSNGTATAGFDYATASGTLNWANGDAASKTFAVTVLDDSVWEGDETVNLSLSNVTGGASLGSPSAAALTIVENEIAQPGQLQFSAATYDVAENGGLVTITATRTGGTDGAVSANYATSDGTATAGSDYATASGTLNWANGDASAKTFAVTVLNDSLVEGDETVSLSLSNVTGGASLGSPSAAALTIADDDDGTGPPSVQEIVAQVSIATYTQIHQDLLYTHLGDNRGADPDGPDHDPARDNILAYFQNLGLAASLETFVHGGFAGENVVGVLASSVNPSRIYLIGAHYDSVDNPGADDNASGVAGVMEAARVLSQFTFENTLIFVAFDQEEQGMHGSYAYVAGHSGDNILGMVNLDMIAYNPAGDNQNKVALYDAVAGGSIKADLLNAFSLYGTPLVAADAGLSGRSDHQPFEEQGFDAALVIESAMENDGNPHYHQAADAVETPDYIDYDFATLITMASVGYLATAATPAGRGADFGDAPDLSYPTLLTHDGARHAITPGLYLGLAVDAEPDGRPDAEARGDDLARSDDEDGVTWTSPLVAGSVSDVAVTASAAMRLDAWVDFNADGDWSDAGEQVFTNQALTAGINSLTHAVPAGAQPGATYARFRASTAGGLSPTGAAADGEVEDYRVTIEPADQSEPPTAVDLLPVSDTGVSDSDNLTRFNNAPSVLQFQVSGTVPGATVNLYSEGAPIGSALAVGAETIVTTSGPNGLMDGAHTITARQSEPEKVESPDSLALLITVDTVAPAAPLAPDLDPASDSGVSNADNLTHQADLAIHVGGLESYYRIYRNGTQIGADYLATSPYTDTGLADGAYAYTARAVDAAGNLSDASEALNVLVDTAGPQVTASTPAPGSTVEVALAALATFSEDLDPGSVTTDTFKVSSAPGEDGEWGTGDDTYVTGAVSYDVAARQATFTPETPLAPGDYALRLVGTASIVDLAGNPLDGEFTGALPSGNGVPGGDFLAPFVVEAQAEVLELGPRQRRVTFQDRDGDTVTVALSGPGTATLTRSAPSGERGDIETVTFEGTDHRTALTISVKEKTGTEANDGTTIQTLSGDGVGTLNMKNVDLVGNTINLDGALKKLVIDDIADGSDIILGGDEADQLTITADEVGEVDLTFPGILKSATVTRWAAGIIQVARVGTLTVKNGNLGAHVEADRIGTVKVTGGDLSGNLRAQNISADRPEVGLALGSVTATGGNITGSITVENGGNAGSILAKAVRGVGGAIGDEAEDTITIAGRLTSVTGNGDIRAAITVNNELGATKGNALNLVKAIGGSLFGAVEVLNGGNLGTLQARRIEANVNVEGKATLVRTELDRVVADEPEPPFVTVTTGGKATVKGANKTHVLRPTGGTAYIVAV